LNQNMNRFMTLAIAVASGAAMLVCVGCKQYEGDWIDASVENQTGQAVRELEVDYPTASFGSDTLAAGATMHYRLQTRGSGPVKVEYTSGESKAVHAQGLKLSEHQHGGLTIRLLPLGKVDFIPSLQPAS
jgi:hypothetical protein